MSFCLVTQAQNPPAEDKTSLAKRFADALSPQKGAAQIRSLLHRIPVQVGGRAGSITVQTIAVPADSEPTFLQLVRQLSGLKQKIFGPSHSFTTLLLQPSSKSSEESTPTEQPIFEGELIGEDIEPRDRFLSGYMKSSGQKLDLVRSLKPSVWPKILPIPRNYRKNQGPILYLAVGLDLGNNVVNLLFRATGLDGSNPSISWPSVIATMAIKYFMTKNVGLQPGAWTLYTMIPTMSLAIRKFRAGDFFDSPVPIQKSYLTSLNLTSAELEAPLEMTQGELIDLERALPRARAQELREANVKAHQWARKWGIVTQMTAQVAERILTYAAFSADLAIGLNLAPALGRPEFSWAATAANATQLTLFQSLLGFGWRRYGDKNFMENRRSEISKSNMTFALRLIGIINLTSGFKLDLAAAQHLPALVSEMIPYFGQDSSFISASDVASAYTVLGVGAAGWLIQRSPWAQSKFENYFIEGMTTPLKRWIDVHYDKLRRRLDRSQARALQILAERLPPSDLVSLAAENVPRPKSGESDGNSFQTDWKTLLMMKKFGGPGGALIWDLVKRTYPLVDWGNIERSINALNSHDSSATSDRPRTMWDRLKSVIFSEASVREAVIIDHLERTTGRPRLPFMSAGELEMLDANNLGFSTAALFGRTLYASLVARADPSLAAEVYADLFAVGSPVKNTIPALYSSYGNSSEKACESAFSEDQAARL